MCDSDKCNRAPGADKRFEDKSLGDKAKDMAHHAKEEVKEGWDKMTGKTPEDRAAKDVKKTADNCAHQMKESREAAADKMREGARHIEGH